MSELQFEGQTPVLVASLRKAEAEGHVFVPPSNSVTTNDTQSVTDDVVLEDAPQFGQFEVEERPRDISKTKEQY